VVICDADHVPEPGFLLSILPHALSLWNPR